MQEWSKATDSSNYVAAVFFDIRKAFDRVWHRGLVAKLSAAGVSGSTLAWFENFLSERSQRTVVGRCFSDRAFLHAGVPQGIILSPLPFILYMNDVYSTTEASLNLFADDTSLYVTAKVEEQLQIKLSAAVQSLISWFDKWIYSVNASKSALMVFRAKVCLSSTYRAQSMGHRYRKSAATNTWNRLQRPAVMVWPHLTW